MLLVFFLTTIVTATIQSTVGALVLHKIWEWFVSAQYGTGPLVATWFGFVLLLVFVELLFTRIGSGKSSEESIDFGELTTKAVSTAASRVLAFLALLGGAWCMGAITGWML